MENKLFATKKEVGISLILSLFFIIFMWGFFSREIFALGINFAVYLVSVVAFFVYRLRKNLKFDVSDSVWIVPLFLLSVSFAVYENPFFKAFSFLLFPVLFSVFYSYSWLERKKEIDWNSLFAIKIVKHILGFLVFLYPSIQFILNTIYNKEKNKGEVWKRVLTGIALLLVALLVIVPLLSSSDPLFAEKLKPFYDAFTKILSTSIVAKIIVFVLLTLGTLTALIAWGRPLTITNTEKKTDVDIVITSIVLGGIFVVYLLFLWIQIDRLWVGALPFDFKETENLVKSGFWQLLFLSVINIAIFLFLYRRTVSVGQKLLGVFSFASLLLLVSSAQRIVLYVTHYGFSYEKFYASYTVLFCGVLFLWLISRLFINKKSNVVKFLAFQFLWMFSLVSIFPVELFILKSNMTLVDRPDTKIHLFEMTMLSPDVLPQIKKYKAEGKLIEEVDLIIIKPNGEMEITKKEFDWNPWIEKQEKRIENKKWYESTLSYIWAK